MCLTLGNLKDQFLAWIEGRNRPRTVAYYRVFLERFAAHVGDVPIGDLRRHHLLSWGKTWHELQTVQRLFNWAHVEMELIDRNPFSKIRRPRPGRRRRVLHRAQVVHLLRAAEPGFRGFLRAMVESIARPQEVRALRWTNLRWDAARFSRAHALEEGEAWFELWDYKSRAQRADSDCPRRIFITRRLGRLLSRLARELASDDAPVFVNSVGRLWTANAVRLRVRRLRQVCGFTADERGERIVAYSIRHTSATEACMKGVPDRVLAELMGHTSTRTTARYQHLSADHLRAALRRL